jgi:hypothetical protein
VAKSQLATGMPSPLGTGRVSIHMDTTLKETDNKESHKCTNNYKLEKGHGDKISQRT